MYAVIMAGGQGTRFWPRSRRKRPKQLLDIVGSESMIRQTVDRLLPFVNPEDIYVVTGMEHVEELVGHIPDVPSENIIAEPVGRNTAPCIGLAAMRLKKRDPEGVMAVLPADHVILDKGGFLETLRNPPLSRITWSAGSTAITPSGSLFLSLIAASPIQGAVFLPTGSAMMFSDGTSGIWPTSSSTCSIPVTT